MERNAGAASASNLARLFWMITTSKKRFIVSGRFSPTMRSSCTRGTRKAYSSARRANTRCCSRSTAASCTTCSTPVASVPATTKPMSSTTGCSTSPPETSPTIACTPSGRVRLNSPMRAAYR